MVEERRLAEEQAKREAEEKAKRDADDAQRLVEEQAKREAEEQAKRTEEEKRKAEERLSAPSLMNRLRKKLRRYNVAGKRKPSVKPKKRVSVS